MKKTSTVLSLLFFCACMIWAQSAKRPYKSVSSYMFNGNMNNGNNSANKINLDSLKHSSWFSIITKKIEAEEYELVFDKKENHYTSPNRKQNLLFTYYKNGFSVKPLMTKIPLFNIADRAIKKKDRKYKYLDDWNIGISLEGYGRGCTIVPFDGKILHVNKRNASISDSSIKIKYNNSEKGMRQDFVVKEKPVGNRYLKLLLRIKTKLHFNISRDGITFANSRNKVEMNYNDMKIHDAAGKEIKGKMIKLNDTTAAVYVNDGAACYPLTIDPLSNTANWTQQGTYFDVFGYSIATAGDVNGDGYSDVIVGAPGSSSMAGKVYVYYGSSTGLSSTASWSQTGENSGDYFGLSVATAGDVNGDGYSDVIVGAAAYSSNKGKAYLYYGSSTGLSSKASWTQTGVNSDDYFGNSVSAAGDVNGDGYSDIIIGAAYPFGSTSRGKAYVYYGGSTGLSTTPSWTQAGENSNDEFGFSVATAGDVNGDGYSEVIVGAYGYSSGKGKAYVFYGGSTGLSTTASWTQTGENSNDGFGYSVATAGDVNGDGYSEVIVGANGYSSNKGKVYIYYGSSTGLSTTPSWTQTGEYSGDYFGNSVATAGDVNGDGYCDVIVGAYDFNYGYKYGTGPGKTYVYYGSSTGLSTTPSWTHTGENSADEFGCSVATAGDVNGDGCSDVIVSAPEYGYSFAIGKAYVFYGSTAGLSSAVSWTQIGENSNDYFGYSVATAGDVNGDGYSDVIVGAYGYSSDKGKVYVYYGGSIGLSTTASWTQTGENSNDEFGYSVATAGDVNGDGFSDVIIGAPGYSSGDGKVYVYYGSSRGLPSTASWTKTGDGIGCSVATAGDVNGDGYSDVIIGAVGSMTVEEGEAIVFDGSPTGLSSTPSWGQIGQFPGDLFGHSVATAGDVNGDGYSDVIVGAYGWPRGGYAGKVYVYYGSSSGLSSTPSWTQNEGGTGDDFGVSVATAGDVNGDGYSDVIVGAYSRPLYIGGAYVFCGSNTGLASTPSSTLYMNNEEGDFSVATAGDVNGDGFSDVILGDYGYSNYKGKVFVYYGSSTGLSSTASWTQTGENNGDYFGLSVATAGDVNGDGYSDVIVGAQGYNSNTGKAYVYYGNSTGGLKNIVQQYQPSSTTIVGPNGNTNTNGSIRLSGFARSPFGRAKGKLVYEYKVVGSPFSGQYSTSSSGSQSSYTDLGTTGIQLNADISSVPTDKVYNWRVRIEYNLADNPYQRYGPWRYYTSYEPLTFGSFKPETKPLPVQLTSFSANLSSSIVTLRWQTATEVNDYGFEVQRTSLNPPFAKGRTQGGWQKIGFVKGSGNSNSPKQYSFVDSNPGSGKVEYRLKQIDNDGTFKYSKTIEVNLSAPTKFTLYQNYPNPFNPTTIIRYDIPEEAHVTLKVYDILGNLVETLVDKEQQPGRYSVQFPIGSKQPVYRMDRLAGGVYIYRLKSGSYVQTKKMVLLK